MSKIMVVDDDPDIRFILTTMLSRAGHKAIGVNTGADCLTKISKVRPDAILLDVMMPGMNGWEVCKALKKNPATNKIPVSMLSIKGSDEDKKKSLECGADRHLTKPVNFKEVLKTIEELAVKN